MKIVTINCTNEKALSTGKLISYIEDYCRDYGVHFLHCYEYGEKNYSEDEYRISPGIIQKINYKLAYYSGKWYGNNSLYTVKLCKRIKEYNPDIVHIHCPNAKSVNLYILLDFFKKNDYRVLITNHAEFFFTGNCSHADECKGYMDGCRKCKDYKVKTQSFLLNRAPWQWKKMKQSMMNFNRLQMVAVSPWQEERIRNATITKDVPVKTIINGIDVDVFKFKGVNAKSDKKTVICVTAMFSDDPMDSKGGIFIIEIAKRLKDVKFLIVGATNTKKKVDLPQNLIAIGFLADQIKLAELYGSADVALITSKRETFGMTVAEALCCGTPVVGFENGGSETITLKEYSSFVKYGDVEEACNRINFWLETGCNREEISKIAREKYSNVRMGREYLLMYQEMIGMEYNAI